MNRGLYAGVTAVALLAGGCAPVAATGASGGDGSTERMAVEPGRAAPDEVAVRLCAGVDEEAVAALLKRHRLVLRKRSSPSIVTLAWEDGRSVGEVARALRDDETGVVCAAQPNYRHRVFSE